MANKKDEDVIVNVEAVYSKTESYIEENQKSLTIIALAIIAIFGLFFAYKYLYVAPRESQAQETIWKAQWYFEVDSLNKALDGDDLHYGLLYVSEEFSGTKTANLANYYIGQVYLKQGDYELARTYLDDVALDDMMVAPVATGSIGDAYLQEDYYDDAIKYYEKAISLSDNEITAPTYLLKSAFVYEELQDYKSAVKAYERIKKQYPASAQAQEVPKYLARARNWVK